MVYSRPLSKQCLNLRIVNKFEVVTVVFEFVKLCSMKDKSNDKGEEESGFGTLLKPIHDVVAKNWSLTIKKFLVSYIDYLHRAHIINFSEAALIVQNSCHFYCKRVDLMYGWVRDFTLSLASHKGENPEEPLTEGNDGKTEKRGQNKRAKEKVSDLDEFKVMPLVHKKNKDKNHIAFEKIGVKKMLECRLATNTKAPGKSGTSVVVYETQEFEMGYKDEFRLHAMIYFDGQLRDGFHRSKAKLVLGPIEFCPRRLTEDFTPADEVAGDNSPLERSIEINPVSPPAPDISDHELGLESDFLEANTVLEPDKEENIESIDPFKKHIPYASLIIHRKFKKRNIFKFPPEIADEGNEKKKGKKIKKVEEEDECSYHLFFSKLLSGRSEDMIALKLRERKRECMKIMLKKRRNLKSRVDNAPDLNEDADDHHDDFEDTLVDLRDAGGMQNSSMSPLAEDDLQINIDQAYEQSRRLMHLNKIKEDGLTVQMRVAAWHEMIRPTLLLAEGRSQFDAHSYGTKIIEQIHDVGETKSFFDIASGNEINEISRYLLSSLMLANTYNVEIVKSNPNELSKDCLNLKLLSTVRHHDELDANVGAAAAGTV